MAEKSRSGTQWTEEDYRAAGWERRSLRFQMDEIAALVELTAEDQMPLARLVGKLAIEEVRRRRRLRPGAKKARLSG